MRLRVAVMATLLNLLVFVLLLVSFVVSSRNVQNDLIREELRVTCRLSKETLDSAAFMDREDYLTVLSEREDIAGLLTAYIAEDGTVVYKDFPFDIQEDHLRMLIKNTTASEVLVAGLTGYQNASRIFASSRTPKMPPASVPLPARALLCLLRFCSRRCFCSFSLSIIMWAATTAWSTS